MKYFFLLLIAFFSSPVLSAVESVASLPPGQTQPFTYNCDAFYASVGVPTSNWQPDLTWPKTPQPGCRVTYTNLQQTGNSVATCPSGWNGYYGLCTSEVPTCPSASPAYTYNSTNQMCERENVCAASGSTVSIGYYDLGTEPSALPLSSTCSGTCGATYEGSGVQARKLVDGIYHYYSVGAYVSTGIACSSGNSSVAPLSTLPADGCASNQTAVTMGTKTKCYSDTGVATDPNSASAVSAADSAANVQSASAIASAASLASAAGLSASGVADAQAGAAGAIAAAGADSKEDPVTKKFCDENPESKICIDQDFGEVTDETLTVKDVPVSITPVSIGSAGTCPAPTVFTIAGRSGSFSWTTYCNFASGIKPIMLVFAWLSAAGILIGGFKS